MRFEFYVINGNWNKKTTEMFNIFNNCHLQEETEKEIKKYLRSPKKYKYIKQYKNEFLGREEIAIYGWEALVEQIDRLIAWQERGRCEYEISAGEKFVTEVNDVLNEFNRYIEEGKTMDDFKAYLELENKRNSHVKSWDCYEQAHANIETIVRDCIYQYKQQLKNADSE